MLKASNNMTKTRNTVSNIVIFHPIPFCESSGLMRLLSVNAFIGRTVRAKAAFNVFNKPVGDAALFFAGARAYGTFHATPGHLPVFFGYRTGTHGLPPLRLKEHDCIFLKCPPAPPFQREAKASLFRLTEPKRDWPDIRLKLVSCLFLYRITHFFQKPGHILPQDFHDVEAFLVLFHISGIQAHSHIPVTGAGHDHLVV